RHQRRIDLHAGKDVYTLPLPQHGENASSKVWTVHGWHDTQTLSDLDAAGHIVRGTQVGLVVPVENLKAIDRAGFPAAQFTKAATVHFFGKPSGRYKDSWQFREGDNE